MPSSNSLVTSRTSRGLYVTKSVNSDSFHRASSRPDHSKVDLPHLLAVGNAVISWCGCLVVIYDKTQFLCSLFYIWHKTIIITHYLFNTYICPAPHLCGLSEVYIGCRRPDCHLALIGWSWYSRLYPLFLWQVSWWSSTPSVAILQVHSSKLSGSLSTNYLIALNCRKVWSAVVVNEAFLEEFMIHLHESVQWNWGGPVIVPLPWTQDCLPQLSYDGSSSRNLFHNNG